ncbi:hypothetical protein F7734_33475 [Scytonema sp. UIC 10036]|uniref:hypothetical protein n=1 Tax=Scytonema sp. UIC 10036 TaxID=2304196 RepID=UPI0012DAB586|nr:hypothetical protein [Scytonema sp. UIC 10036]MUG96986.1 hypothetical protein [Scytonema sp. UIC 10036]
MKRTRRVKTQPAIKGQLPADPVGQRYVNRFYHGFHAIIAPVPLFGASPDWRTINYRLQPSQLWELHQDNTKLVGIRFDTTTLYATIDLDTGGDYHNLESVKKIKAALENIGIVDVVPSQSSESGGYHLVLPLEEPVHSFGLACALQQTLTDAGFQVRQGHLEIFPNVKAYCPDRPTDFNAIRVPLQAGCKSFLLDDELSAIGNDVSTFLDHCDRAAYKQDLKHLNKAIEKAYKRHVKEKYRKKTSQDAEKWRRDWEKIIATGWTGFGQTNEILPVIVGYGIVFLRLSGDDLVDYAVSTATNAPGYLQYCRHQHEIKTRVLHWMRCSERNDYYSAYPSYPQRLEGTFSATFAEAIAFRGHTNTKNNIVTFERCDRRQEMNLERSLKAQRRIQVVVQTLEWNGGLPDGATNRAKLIREAYKQRFNKSLSQETLHKYLHLWHPTRYVADPWIENSCEDCQMGDYAHCAGTSAMTDELKNAQNPCQIDEYEHSPYMKVLCLPPAATAPQRRVAAEVTEFRGESERGTQPPPAVKTPTLNGKPQQSETTPSAIINADPLSDAAIEEIKRATRLRLQAGAYANKVLQEYRLMTGRFICGSERSSLLKIAKMQFYLDSECNSLIAEALEWAAANPGCLPFTLETAFQERGGS